MILVLGGTSDSLKVCEKLNQLNQEYILSVTTNYGLELAKKHTKNIIVDRLTLDKMTKFIKDNDIDMIIDSTHPYAVEVSKNAIQCSDDTKTEYIRYERKSLLEDIEYDKSYVVNTLEEACELANKIGNNIFLSTGSKNLSQIVEKIGHKNLIARVLPTSDVIISCEKLGFSAENIIAMKGPFSTQINKEFYQHYNIDLVITKESGTEGGFLEKIDSCKDMNIPIIIISRHNIQYPNVMQDIKKLENKIIGGNKYE